MVISLTACGRNDSTNIENIVSSAPVTESASDSEDAAFTVSHDNEEIYFSALSEFYDLYQQALEADTISMRHTLMAMAEAKFLESGVGIPIYTAGGSYKMSRLAYRTGGYASWMGDMVNYDQMVVTNEIILKEDYEYLRDLWNELTGTGTYTESAKAYLEEQGYTFTDTYTDTFDRVGTTWDFLSSGDIHDVDSFIDHLYKYNSEGQLEPHLATSYEVSEDGLTYTFYLREGVIWTDSQGRKVADLMAGDWVAAAQHLADTGANSIENLNGLIEGMAEYLSGETTDFSTVGIKALDDYTLQYTLTKECPYFMTMLTDTAFLPMSRTYYESQGGVFGLAAYDGASVSSSYVYGIDQDHIAYCGPYLCTNVTDNNSISYVANPDYWNAENVVIQTVELIYDDGSDVTREYNDFLNGVGSTLVLDTAQLEMAKEDGNFDTYVTVADNAMNIFMLWCNLYRQTYANVADGAVASTKTDEQKEVSVAAFQNQHFRLALAYSVDRATYISQSLGEDLKYVCIRNTYTPGTFVSLEEEATVEIGGESVTFPAGTYYAEIIQAQLDADGYPIKVWDEEGVSSDGFDGWYDPEAAAEKLAIAIVGESGCGKSVFTKAFAGMLDNNGFIDRGDILFFDDELADTVVPLDRAAAWMIGHAEKKLNEYSRLELGAPTYRQILELEKKNKSSSDLSEAELDDLTARREELAFMRAEAFNHKQTLDSRREKEQIREQAKIIAGYDAQLKELDRQQKQRRQEHRARARQEAGTAERLRARLAQLRRTYRRECAGEISAQTRARNQILAKEIYLSIGRYPLRRRLRLLSGLIRALRRAMEMMKKVGIPNAEYRFDDYPFQYSGGMRQRIVIAIALSCQPKILICNEPTTALDVTIQAQILKLIKDLQKELHYTIVFITHDLGVVANVADRVAVLYAGQIVELGKVDEIFYDPRHPYTWALLSSLPQLADRDTALYSIAGTPPSLYNRIVGDAFAPRNPFCLKVDTMKEPPMFKVTDTHYAKTWLLDPRAPKVDKPEAIRDIHGTLIRVFNI